MSLTLYAKVGSFVTKGWDIWSDFTSWSWIWRHVKNVGYLFTNRNGL